MRVRRRTALLLGAAFLAVSLAAFLFVMLQPERLRGIVLGVVQGALADGYEAELDAVDFDLGEGVARAGGLRIFRIASRREIVVSVARVEAEVRPWEFLRHGRVSVLRLKDPEVLLDVEARREYHLAHDLNVGKDALVRITAQSAHQLRSWCGNMVVERAPANVSLLKAGMVARAQTPVAPTVATATAPPAPAVVPTPAPVRPAFSTAGTRTLVVAIDAGHGGQDPGAIGPTGKREKDVTLAMARELARQVNAIPGLKAFLVRDSDVFIPLPMRAQRARAAKADIFVSLHADAAENRSARGSSVYVLSTKGASSQRARWLADKENAADLVGGVRLQQTENVLAGVLLDLAQSGHMRASEDAANHVLGGLKRVGNNHKPNIERANFAVLRTSDMPAMLVETAFISNADEEKRLVDPAYQRKVAGAVVDGINTYFTRQPPPGTLFAARAEAEILAMAGAGGTP